VLTGLIVGMLIPSNDPDLFKSVLSLFEATMPLLMLHRKTGNAGQSPFVLVFNRAGVKSLCMFHFMTLILVPKLSTYSALPHIVNAVVLTSAFSSANGMLFSASRLLFALGVQGQAPRFVTTVSRNGLPYVAVAIGVRQSLCE
jgi:yeast amino acid transporter